MVKSLQNSLLRLGWGEKEPSNDCALLKELLSVTRRTTGGRNQGIGIGNSRKDYLKCNI